jgi:multidrug efflux system membrane fusion protein
MFRGRILVPLVLAVPAAIGGCHGQPPQPAPPQPPALPVSRPVQQNVSDYVDFTGRIDAVQSVDIRARVTGYLVEMPFKEGSEVKKGNLLFRIDPRPYQAQLDQAKGQVNLYQAQLDLARATYNRFKSLSRSTPGAVSEQQLEEYKAQLEEARAQMKAYQAGLEVYRLNMEFARVVSPIDGRVSRYYLTVGNLANQDQTLLTTVVSVDPMYVYWDTDEPTLLRILRAVSEGKMKQAEDGTNPVLMGLQDEDGFPHEGKIDFVNNQVSPTTGSITMRGVFPNPKLKGGVRLLSPGMFVRVRLPIGPPHPALLVIDRAVGSDQGLKYVYVVDAQNKAQYRRVTTGPLQDNGLRVITRGLKPDERVVVGGLQQVRPRTAVRPDEIPMPTLGPSAEADKETGGQGNQDTARQGGK